MSFLNNDNKSKDLYYNINVVNKDNIPKYLSYIDTRSNNLISNVDDYMLSILRFQIDLSECPLMIFPNTKFDAFQPPPYISTNNSYYTVTIENTNTNEIHQEGISYLSFGRQEPYIYNFQNFCDMINVALKTSDTQTTGEPSVHLPYFFYSEDEKQINLALSPNFNSEIAGNKKLYINKNLYDDLGKDFKGHIRDLSNGRYYEFQADKNGVNSFNSGEVRVNGSLISNAWNVGQISKPYYPNLGHLIGCKSIVFTTSQIPIINEYISDDLDIINDTSNSFIKIMKDFELSLEGPDAIFSRGIQNFNISSEFQMSNLKSGGEGLHTIDLQAFWRDKKGRLHELYIPINSSFSMKLLFRHK